MKQEMKDAMSQASMQGISRAEIKKWKAMMSAGDAKPTKKYHTRAERVTKRKIQKESRRINRGVNQGKRAKK